MSERTDNPRRETLPSSVFLRSMLAGALVTALLGRTGLLQSMQVAGVHMAPTLVANDRVFVHAPLSNPALGDVVAYRTPLREGEVKLGRVVGVAGDRVEMDGRGLLVRGKPASDGSAEACVDDACLTGSEVLGTHRYFTRRADRLDFLYFPVRTVPEGYVFVLNDNRIDERDSRIYGAIPLEAVVGVASIVYYASDEKGIRWDRMNRRVS